MARTSSLNYLSCGSPCQTPHSLNASPVFTEKSLLSLKIASLHPLPKNRLLQGSKFGGLRKKEIAKKAAFGSCAIKHLPWLPHPNLLGTCPCCRIPSSILHDASQPSPSRHCCIVVPQLYRDTRTAGAIM